MCVCGGGASRLLYLGLSAKQEPLEGSDHRRDLSKLNI